MEVVEPPALRQRVIAMADEVAALYARSQTAIAEGWKTGRLGVLMPGPVGNQESDR